MSITHNIRDLSSDLDRVPSRATRRVAEVVRHVATDGNRLAKNFARESAGDHGEHYHKAFQAESDGPLGLSWVYGPVAAMPQGGMSFEFGSRNQPPHLDLNRSADLISPGFGQRVGDAAQGAFW